MNEEIFLYSLPSIDTVGFHLSNGSPRTDGRFQRGFVTITS
jgi:hypothetical protein